MSGLLMEPPTVVGKKDEMNCLKRVVETNCLKRLVSRSQVGCVVRAGPKGFPETGSPESGGVFIRDGCSPWTALDVMRVSKCTGTRYAPLVLLLALLRWQRPSRGCDECHCSIPARIWLQHES